VLISIDQEHWILLSYVRETTWTQNI
jgi:hypothetical protein